ncbi:MAG: hypothetical protein WC936_04600 [Candidatus Nanoarchaeia archaeon]|jgi:hypothetical protein
MELKTYKSELRKAFSAENKALIESLVSMSRIDHQIDDEAREEVLDYCIVLSYQKVTMKKAAKKPQSRNQKHNP